MNTKIAPNSRGKQRQQRRIEAMKYVDDYSAKLEIWAREGKVCHMPAIANLPRFGHRKFRSHAEMNTWKRELLGQLAERGGAKWRK